MCYVVLHLEDRKRLCALASGAQSAHRHVDWPHARASGPMGCGAHRKRGGMGGRPIRTPGARFVQWRSVRKDFSLEDILLRGPLCSIEAHSAQHFFPGFHT